MTVAQVWLKVIIILKSLFYSIKISKYAFIKYLFWVFNRNIRQLKAGIHQLVIKSKGLFNCVFYLIKIISTHTPINNSMRIKCMYDINENATIDDIFGSHASISSSQVDKNEVRD